MRCQREFFKTRLSHFASTPNIHQPPRGHAQAVADEPGYELENLDAQLGLKIAQAIEVVPSEHEQRHALSGHGRGGAGLVVDEGHLSEVGPSRERDDDRLGFVGTLFAYFDLAVDDESHIVLVVAFLEDNAPGAVLHDIHVAGDSLDLFPGEMDRPFRVVEHVGQFLVASDGLNGLHAGYGRTSASVAGSRLYNILC